MDINRIEKELGRTLTDIEKRIAYMGYFIGKDEMVEKWSEALHTTPPPSPAGLVKRPKDKEERWA